MLEAGKMETFLARVQVTIPMVPFTTLATTSMESGKVMEVNSVLEKLSIWEVFLITKEMVKGNASVKGTIILEVGKTT